MKIRSVNLGRNKWCGPAAVSAITGVSTDVAADLMRKAYGRTAIKGSYTSEVASALKALGYRMEAHNAALSTAHPTFAQWCRETSSFRGQDVLLLDAGQHWRVVQGRRHVCSITKEIVSIGQAPMRRARVNKVWVVTKVGEPTVNVAALGKPKPHTPEQKADGKARAKAKALLKAHPEISYEVEWLGKGEWHVWVHCDCLEERDIADPYEGDHIAANWREALPMIETYAEILTKEKVQ